jgi:hypothetical protein
MGVSIDQRTIQMNWLLDMSLVRVLKQGISYNLFGYVPEL